MIWCVCVIKKNTEWKHRNEIWQNEWMTGRYYYIYKYIIGRGYSMVTTVIKWPLKMNTEREEKKKIQNKALQDSTSHRCWREKVPKFIKTLTGFCWLVSARTGRGSLSKLKIHKVWKMTTKKGDNREST